MSSICVTILLHQLLSKNDFLVIIFSLSLSVSERDTYKKGGRITENVRNAFHEITIAQCSFPHINIKHVSFTQRSVLPSNKFLSSIKGLHSLLSPGITLGHCSLCKMGSNSALCNLCYSSNKWGMLHQWKTSLDLKQSISATFHATKGRGEFLDFFPCSTSDWTPEIISFSPQSQKHKDCHDVNLIDLALGH